MIGSAVLGILALTVVAVLYVIIFPKNVVVSRAESGVKISIDNGSKGRLVTTIRDFSSMERMEVVEGSLSSVNIHLTSRDGRLEINVIETDEGSISAFIRSSGPEWRDLWSRFLSKIELDMGENAAIDLTNKTEFGPAL